MLFENIGGLRISLWAAGSLLWSVRLVARENGPGYYGWLQVSDYLGGKVVGL